jgi:hypothetical protein
LALLLASLLSGAAEARSPAPGLSVQAQAAIRAHHSHRAIELLAPVYRDPARYPASESPPLLLLLGEAAEANVAGLNSRYWTRGRLDPHSPSWHRFISSEQRWAARNGADFEYDEPRGRYRYTGDAYKLLKARFPRHPLVDEADWRLIPRQEDDWYRRRNADPAMEDAERYRQFLKAHPRSRHRWEAKLAIGWDTIYASGVTWGDPDKRLLHKGQDLLREVMRAVPGRPEARKAQVLLERSRNPFSYSPYGRD